MNVTAIIQARMTSTRLPGKVLMHAGGKPLLQWQLEQLRPSQAIARVVIATTLNADDDPVEDFARQQGVPVYRGSELDVLDRYFQAAKTFGAEHVMRLTADCPLVQPQICDLVAREYFDAGADYAITGSNFAEGVDCEVLRFAALERSWKDAAKASEREHATLYIRNHPEIFTIRQVNNDRDDSSYRITVDQQEDFQVVEAILENVSPGPDGSIAIGQVREFLDAHPEIHRLNSSIERNEGLKRSLLEDGSA